MSQPIILTGGPRHGQPMPDNPHGFSTYHFIDLTVGCVAKYDARTGVHLESIPILGAPFADYRPDRWDYERATRPDRVRANIIANLPPGRAGRFVRSKWDNATASHHA